MGEELNIEDMFEFVDIPNSITPDTQYHSNIIKEDLNVKLEVAECKEENNNFPVKGDDKKYSCPHCDFKSRRKEECQEHINGVHNNIKPYNCTYEGCDFSTSYRHGLRKHIASVHLGKRPAVKPRVLNHSCDKCDFKTNKHSHLLEHNNGVHENIKPFVCTYEDCSYATSYKGGVKKHVDSVHLQLKQSTPREKKWMCSKCEYRTGKEQYLKEHIMAKHDNIRPFICTHQPCKFASVSVNGLKKHVDAVHLKLKGHLCDKCDYSANTKHLLRLHVDGKHSDCKPFICSFLDCDYATVYPASIRKHTDKVHLNLKPFICDRGQCQYSTDNKTQLTKHISAVHDNTLAFKCEYSDCEYRANFKNSIKLHVNKVHLNLNEDYKCESCDYTCTTSTMIKWHYTARHTDAVEKCPHCQFETKWKTSLSSHIKIVHQGAKGFNCDLCDYECARKSRLKAHYNGVHLGISHQCPECPMKSNWKHKIDLHYKEVHNNQDTQSYFCDQCDFQTFRRWRLEPHIYFKHGEGSTIEFSKDEEGLYFCDQCEYKCVKMEIMKTHYYKGKHEGEVVNQPKSLLLCEQYTCDKCIFQTISPRKFSLHMYYKHGDGVDLQFDKNEDGIYQCVKCDFNTTQVSSIKSHHFSGKHTAAFQRMCSVCTYNASTAVDMKHHKFFTHGNGVNISIEANSEGTFCCDRCKYTSANETQFGFHLMMGVHKIEKSNV